LTRKTDAFGRYEAPSPLATHISVLGDAIFHHRVNIALTKLSLAPSGRKLINDFWQAAQQGNELTISQTNADNIVTSARFNEKQAAKYPNFGLTEENIKASQLARKRYLGLKGQGANAVITWNPNKSLRLNAAGQPLKLLATDPSESHLILAHELIHARRIVKGTSTIYNKNQTNEARNDPSTPLGKEELRAVGIGSKSNEERVSENSIRKELGYPLRTSYNRVD
jgi:NleD-like pathogen effector protein (putative zinc metallopeptidase)